MVEELELFFFFFNDTATTEIYTLSLHDALPILARRRADGGEPEWSSFAPCDDDIKAVVLLQQSGLVGLADHPHFEGIPDRKSTRLNSSHANISYAVFCLKKKNNKLQLFFYSSDT